MRCNLVGATLILYNLNVMVFNSNLDSLHLTIALYPFHYSRLLVPKNLAVRTVGGYITETFTTYC